MAGSRLGVRGVTLSCQLATHGAPNGLVLGPVLFHIFFDDQMQSQKFAENSRLCGSFDLLEVRKTPGIDGTRPTV